MRTRATVATLLVVAIAVSAGVGRAFQPGAPAEPPQPAGDEKSDLAYGIGFYLGEEVLTGLQADGVEIDRNRLIRGFIDGLTELPAEVPRERLDEILFAVNEEMQRRAVERLLAADPAFKALYESNAAKSAEFMRENANRPGVVVLDDGIQYEVVREGDGPKPGPDGRVVVSFKAFRMDGSQYDGMESKEVSISKGIPAAQRILPMMPVGAVWRVAVPPESAYGGPGNPPFVGPNEAVVVEVEMVAIK